MLPLSIYQHPSLRIYLGRRAHALSRFPARPVGSSRRRDNYAPRPAPEKLEPIFNEETASGKQSQLWNTSQRPPNSNPDEGLKRLLLENNMLIVERQIEMLNIFIGFEQSNKYTIMNENGVTVGYIAEEPKGFLGTMARQVFATHRPFRAVILDTEGTPVLWVRRPFAWINSRMYVQRLKDYTSYSPEGEPVLDTFAEVQQIWHPWRRRYDLFLREKQMRILSIASEPEPEPEPVASMFTQFAKVDMGFLAWDFRLLNERGEDVSFIGRAFRGFGRELFTDTGQYTILFGPGPHPHGIENSGETWHAPPRGLTLDERALVLALAVNIDFDYFSRHSGHGGGGLFAFSHWD